MVRGDTPREENIAFHHQTPGGQRLCPFLDVLSHIARCCAGDVCRCDGRGQVHRSRDRDRRYVLPVFPVSDVACQLELPSLQAPVFPVRLFAQPIWSPVFLLPPSKMGRHDFRGCAVTPKVSIGLADGDGAREGGEEMKRRMGVSACRAFVGAKRLPRSISGLRRL